MVGEDESWNWKIRERVLGFSPSPCRDPGFPRLFYFGLDRVADTLDCLFRHGLVLFTVLDLSAGPLAADAGKRGIGGG